MNSQLVDLAAPPQLPSDAELMVPHGADPESAIVGPIAGRYDLGERIARGGMGIVYRAHDRLLNRTVAVKVMRGKFVHRPDLLRRFTAEARINGRLQHPGVVPVYEVGTLSDARPFIAMKLIEGQTLARLLRERVNPTENQVHFLKVFEAFCQTMAYAHQEGVIHRDLKPDNVMVGAFGEVQVMDWGLAKFLDPAAAVSSTPDGFEAIEKSAYLSDGITNTPVDEFPTHATAVVAVGPETPGVGQTTAGEVFGTLAYMPPEQARGEMDRVDRRSDVFSLGAILCQILTGQPPYFGPSESLKEMVRGGKLFGANILLDRCGADQTLIVLAKHCLEVDPLNRPADAGVLAVLVTECLEKLQDRTRQMEDTRLQAEARVAEAEARERLARRARRLAFMLAVAGVFVAGMLAAGLGWYANDRLSRDADELGRRTVAIQQIDDAINEADNLDGQARTENGTWLERDAAGQQATAACRRAEVLFAVSSSVPGETHDRFEFVKAKSAETNRATRLAVALQEWRSGLFLMGGSFDPSAAKRCRELFALHGFDLFGRNASLVAADLKSHLAATSIADALVNWLAVSADAGERERLADIVGEVEGTPTNSWIAALKGNVPNELVKLADQARHSPVPAAVFAVAGRRLIDAGRAGDAERLLLAGVRLYPADFPINAQLGILLHADPDRRLDAVRYLTAACTAHPNDPIVSLTLGSVLADAGRGAEARRLLQTAAKVDPQLESAHVRLGQLLAGDGDVEGARASFAAAVAIDPSDAVAQIGLGQSELARGDHAAAEKAFRAANANKPNAMASAGLGAIHLKRWEASKAIGAYRTASELQPANIDYRLGLIRALRMANNSPAAIREAQIAAKTVPSSAAVQRVLGELLRTSGNKAAAIDAYRAAEKCDPHDVDTKLQLGMLYEALDDMTSAQEAYQAAAAISPEDSTIKAALARVQSESNRAPATIDACRQLLARRPGNLVVRHQLGRLLAERGDVAAIDELKKAADDKHATNEMRLDLAEALLRFGRFREAASAYRDAAARFPEESAEQLAAQTAARNALRWAGLETRLPEALAGAIVPSTAAAWADFGEVCRHTGRFAGAARFFAAAAKDDAKFARLDAVYSALAGFKIGSDAKDLTDAKRAELRKSALTALQHDRSWTADPALAAIREPARLEDLTPEEKSEWQLLWAGEPVRR